MNIQHSRLRWPVIVLAGAIIAVVLFALSAWKAAEASADADTAGEIAYLATIESYGIPYSTEDAAIEAGYAICEGFREGLSLNTVVRAGVTGSHGF